MRRVLFLNHVGTVGGAELAMLDVARACGRESRAVLFSDGPLRGLLERAGVTVDVISSRWARRGTLRATTPPNPRDLVELAATIARVARIARGQDLLFANSQKALVVGSAAAALARRPLIHLMHEILTLEHFSRWNVRLNVALANRFATRILANSEATAKAFRAWGGREDGVHVVHCGFDPDLYEDPDAAGIASIRSAMSLGSGPLLGLFGRITPGKGHHVLIEALPSLPGVAVLVAGEVEDDAYPRRLRERAEALGVAHRVHFVGFRTDVPRLMQIVDVVVQPSLFEESFGRVVAEGMLAGRPVVASRSGGVVEIVEDGVTGLLVRPGDAGELATAIARLLADPTFARGLAAAGRASARGRFGLDAMLAAVLLHLDEVARGESKGRQRPPSSR